MRKNWFKIGVRDFEGGRVSLLTVLLMAGDRGAASEYARGRAFAKKSGVIPYYLDGPGHNRIARYENYRDS